MSATYLRVGDVWHVRTDDVARHLGYELGVRVRVRVHTTSTRSTRSTTSATSATSATSEAESDEPRWIEAALHRLAIDLEGMTAEEALLARGMRIGPPYFKETQRLVPVVVELGDDAFSPVQVLPTFGLFLDEVELLRADHEVGAPAATLRTGADALDAGSGMQTPPHAPRRQLTTASVIRIAI